MLLRPIMRSSGRIAIFTLLVAALLLNAAAAEAQRLNRPTSAKGWSDLIHARYQKIKTMHAAFEQSIIHKESGIEELRTGELFFQKPFLARWVSNPPHREMIVIDKQFLWQYFPDEELALKFKAADVDAQSEFLGVITGRTPLIEKFRIIQQQEVEGVFSLKLLPFEPSMSLVEAVIWVDMESGLILRLLYTDFYGNTNDISFVNQELDVRISKEVFELKLPPGTMIEDNSK